jgi:hypothetical protein
MCSFLYMAIDKNSYIAYNKGVISNLLVPMINNTIVNDIKGHADREGSGYRNWYCGVAANPDDRLFDNHNVPRDKDKAWWIKRNAGSEQNARDTEDCLLRFGFDGNPGGGDYSTIHVYAYKKIPGITRE